MPFERRLPHEARPENGAAFGIPFAHIVWFSIALFTDEAQASATDSFCGIMASKIYSPDPGVRRR